MVNPHIVRAEGSPYSGVFGNSSFKWGRIIVRAAILWWSVNHLIVAIPMSEATPISLGAFLGVYVSAIHARHDISSFWECSKVPMIWIYRRYRRFLTISIGEKAGDIAKKWHV